MTIIIVIISLLILSSLIYFVIPTIQINKFKSKIIQTKPYKKLSEYIGISLKRKLVPKKTNRLNPIILLIITFCIFGIFFIIFYSYIKVPTTALILSLPFLFSPVILFKLLLNHEKSKIIKALPMYVVNIKNHIDRDNNIIGAIQRTTVEEPLKKYVDGFKNNISRGMNVIEAFNNFKNEVNVKAFNDFVNACQVCYLNGGDFNNVLERYINIITKENIHKESAREKAYADILTLLIMIVLNVLVVVMFVFTNNEYASIMRETFFGKLVLNFNAISYILIAYLISKIYKEE